MKPTIAQKAPYPINVEAGKTYYWCSCGKSKTQTYCDDSHKETEFTTKQLTSTKSKSGYFC